MLISAETETLLKKIDQLELSDRLRQWKQESVSFKPKISSDRIRLVIESMKETEGQDINIRRAKALEKVCQNIPIAIHDWQMLVGSDTKHLIAGVPPIDMYAGCLPALEKEVSLQSPLFKGTISEQDRDVLRDCVSYFKGKTRGERQHELYESLVGTWYDDLVEAKGAFYGERVGYSLQVYPVMYERILAEGLRGFVREAEQRIQRFKEEMKETDPEKLYFWQAAVISCEAVICLSRRYAKLAREIAGTEQDAERRKELDEIAKVCEWVPENPARTFHEACQAVVFIQQGLRLEIAFSQFSPGRPDQYLLPYFEREIRDGSLTLERATEFIGNEIAFLNNQVQMTSFDGMVQQSRANTRLTVGGLKPNGEEASNTLTYLFLHVLGLISCAEPHVSFSWHPGTPRWAMLKAIETNFKIRGGIPQFQNGLHEVEYWARRGYPLEEARDLVGEGCAEMVPRKGANNRAFGRVTNMALAVDLALHNGVAPRTGKQLGPRTGDPRNFGTFEDVLAAVKKQYEFTTRRLLWLASLGCKDEEGYHRQPFHSAVRAGCLESGKDAICLVPQRPLVNDRGIIDTADSLMAIKRLVFDERRLTTDELLEALDSNFEGERGQEIRQLCLGTPKFGNDIEEVDLLAREMGHFSADVIRSASTEEFKLDYIGRFGVSWHYYGGLGVGALPNGRKSGEPLCDGSISPMQGQDKHGPTAVMRSAIKADFSDSLTTILNLRFSGSLMKSPQNRQKLVDLTETFFRNGGQYVQYNLLDAATLRDAQKHPEKYQDLVVRVGGFSAYFVHLVKEIQDELISRTEHTL